MNGFILANLTVAAQLKEIVDETHEYMCSYEDGTYSIDTVIESAREAQAILNAFIDSALIEKGRDQILSK